MKRYTVVLTRMAMESADVTIEAESLNEACAHALARNAELDWHRVGSDDQPEVSNVSSDEPENNAA